MTGTVSRGRRLLGLSASMLVLSATVMVSPSASGAPSSRPGEPRTAWSELTQLPSGVADLDAVSCGMPSACVAIDAGSDGPRIPSLIFTQDSGHHWNQGQQLPAVAALDGVVCTTAFMCLAVGDTRLPSGKTVGIVVRSGTGGQTWSTWTAPSNVAVIEGVSCATVSQCVAVGATRAGSAAILATVDSGATWQRELVPPGVTNLAGVACPSLAVCTAVGAGAQLGSGAPLPAVIGTADAGTTWSIEQVPGFPGSIRGVSCASTTSCVAVGDRIQGTGSSSAVVIATADGGSSWGNLQVFARGTSIDAVSCASVTTCHAVGAFAPGTVHHTQGLFWTTTDAGQSWASARLPGKIQALHGISCPSSTDCQVVGQTQGNRASTYGRTGAALGTTDGGQSWMGQSLRFGLGLDVMTSVSCSIGQACATVGNNLERGGAFLAHTPNGGRSGGIVPAPPEVTALTAIACPSAMVCVTVGDLAVATDVDTHDSGAVALRSVDGGATWSVVLVDHHTSGATGVTCLSVTVCYVVTAKSQSIARQTAPGHLLRTTDGGSSWTTLAVPTSFQQILGITCLTARACMLFGFAVVAHAKQSGEVASTTNGGASWSVSSALAAEHSVSSIVCQSAKACLAIASGDLFGTVNGGATWRRAGRIPSSHAIDALVCPTAHRCTALVSGIGESDYESLISADGFTTWTAHAILPALEQSSLSCTTVGVCFAVGGSADNGAATIMKYLP